jgi:hypothetical protein
MRTMQAFGHRGGFLKGTVPAAVCIAWLTGRHTRGVISSEPARNEPCDSLNFFISKAASTPTCSAP